MLTYTIVVFSGVGGFEGSGGVQIRGSGGRKSPSRVQGQSSGGGLGAKPPEADDKTGK